MSEIVLVRQESAPIAEADREAARRVLFGQIDGLSQAHKKTWRRLMNWFFNKAQPGEMVVTENGVKILGFTNWPGRLPAASSALYARNLLTFLTTFWDKEAKAPKLPADDDIVKGVSLTRAGAVVHPLMKPAS